MIVYIPLSLIITLIFICIETCIREVFLAVPESHTLRIHPNKPMETREMAVASRDLPPGLDTWVRSSEAATEFRNLCYRTTQAAES